MRIPVCTYFWMLETDKIGPNVHGDCQEKRVAGIVLILFIQCSHSLIILLMFMVDAFLQFHFELRVQHPFHSGQTFQLMLDRFAAFDFWNTMSFAHVSCFLFHANNHWSCRCVNAIDRAQTCCCIAFMRLRSIALRIYCIRVCGVFVGFWCVCLQNGQKRNNINTISLASAAPAWGLCR